MHVVIDRHKNHDIHLRLLDRALHLSGEDHIQFGTVVCKGEEEHKRHFLDVRYVKLVRQ